MSYANKISELLQMRVVRFVVSGGSAAVTEYASFALLHSLGVHILLANSLSFSCGLLVSFSLNKLWVFKSEGNAKSQFGMYLVLALVNLCISNALLWLTTNELGIPALIAKLGAMVTIAIWNYLIFSRFIFTRK